MKNNNILIANLIFVLLLSYSHWQVGVEKLTNSVILWTKVAGVGQLVFFYLAENIYELVCHISSESN